MNIYHCVTLLILPVIFGNSCMSKPRAFQNAELVKGINEVLDLIDKSPADERLVGPPKDPDSSGFAINYAFVLEQPEGKLLIEKANTSLPLIFERLKKTSVTSASLFIYFIILGQIKSPESIPYIADYFSACTDEEYNTQHTTFYALSAAMQITGLKLYDEEHSFVGHRLDIAKKLRQWYEGYKKQPPPGSQDPGKDQNTLKQAP